MSIDINIHDSFFWSSSFFLAGVGIISALNNQLFALMAILLLICFFLVFRKYKLALFSLAAIAGTLYFGIYSHIQAAMTDIPFGKQAEFLGMVKAVSGTETAQYLSVSLNGEYQGGVRVSTRLYPEFKYGDEIKFIGVINYPDSDFRDYYLSRGIFGESDFPKIEIIGSGRGNPIAAALIGFGKKIREVFITSLPKEKAAFLAGITIGGKDGFSKDLKEKMALSGTTHLVAMSGYNITIIALAAASVFACLFSETIAFYLSILTIILFVVMAGAGASVVRAAIMGVIGLFAVRAERIFSPRNAMAIAGFGMVLFNPRVLIFDAGFQLSFAALIGMLYLAPALQKLFGGEMSGFLDWKKNAISTASAQILALPVLFMNFGYFSLSSLVANVLILEFIPITMALGFVLAGIGFFSGFLAGIMAFPATILISYEFLVINFFSKFPLAVSLEKVPWIFWLIYYSAIFLFVIYKHSNGE